MYLNGNSLRFNEAISIIHTSSLHVKYVKCGQNSCFNKKKY